ncbi:circularly permuted type 2 ATP-grasp protein [Myxosarcina sp. GI1]|uniref:circularly permuted type 2 ATP-grasp protein n=1 Tax=Myxosarcina sp. GI1 TaxID=1541065 RepID=UPI00068B121F|nr:circularly permuted type 2 ATP-grasp protein [Myxosarcina sp. GI1]
MTATGEARSPVVAVVEWLQQRSLAELEKIEQQAQQILDDLGAIYIVDGKKQVLPFDIIPRIIAAKEWQKLEAGLKQRVRALNLFCADIYDRQQIISDGIIPENIVTSAVGFVPECMGMKPPNDVWCHVSGIDLVKDKDGSWFVLEDNLRIPSGIAYALYNRSTMKQVTPQLLDKVAVEPIANYPQELLKTMQNNFLGDKKPTIAVITPGSHETAYFEHSFLAEQMGAYLVEPKDLVIDDGYLKLHDDERLQQIDVLYRRANFDLLDKMPGNNYDSGTAAIIALCKQGKLAVANAVGTGVADDKVIYAYVPEMIRYYLDEEPLLSNVPTYLCWQESDRAYVLDNLDKLVVKAASGEGGKGMLIGNKASQEERETFAQKIKAQPREYIAQPTLALSRIPTLVDGNIAGRHVDLRPYILHQGDRLYVFPGGLTRVALVKDSLVVNSTQGGGSKDTWILAN